MKVQLIALVAGAVAMTSPAKTLALWPMEWDSSRGEWNMRNAVGPDYEIDDMPDTAVYADQTVGWNLPPNPDPTSNPLFSTVNRVSVYPGGGNNFFQSRCPAFSEAMRWTHDFTLEGWIRPNALKKSGSYYVFQANGGAYAGNGWTVFLTGTLSEGVTTWQHQINLNGVAGMNSTQNFGRALTAEEVVSFTNGWHHVAVVFDYRDPSASNMSVFRLYLDGVHLGNSKAFANANCTPSSHVQVFGRGGGVNPDFAFDYWRLSDEALEPTAFLNAGGAGTIVPPVVTPEQKTIAYWKLGATASGLIDARDYVGSADLSQGFNDNPFRMLSAYPLQRDQITPTMSNMVSSTIAASSDSAFAGQPPNATVTITGGNKGSFAARNNGHSFVTVADLGKELETTCDFTVEAYLRYRADCDSTAARPADDCYILGAGRSQTTVSWALVTQLTDPARQLQLWVRDYTTTDLGFVFKGKFENGFLPRDPKWVHVAVVHDAAAHSWTLYMDGASCGTVVESGLTGTSRAEEFFLCGRKNAKSFFTGNIDCVRVSGAKLAPQQFLCEATSPLAATNVLGFWPLDTPDGVYLDGRDETGLNPITGGQHADSVYRVSAVTDDQPSISNPDPSAKFHGDPRATAGSVRFRTDASNGAKSWLQSRDETVVGGMVNCSEFTLEFYTKLSGTGGYVYFIAPLVAADATPNYNGKVNFVSYGANGFVVFDLECANAEYTCADTKGAIPKDEWAHVAIVKTHETVESVVKTVYRFYVNGALKGSLANNRGNGVKAPALSFFGAYDYWNSAVGWDGDVSSLRLSRGALDPSEFLCATPAAAPAEAPKTGTLAYWPFDYKDGVLDLSGCAATPYAPNRADANTLGTDDRAVVVVPNADTGLVRRVKQNSGAVALTDPGTLNVHSLGSELSLTRPFTVEGWLKWTNQPTNADQVVFGAYKNADGNVDNDGWFVFVDYSGARPALKLASYATGNWSPVAFGTLVSDMTGWDGVWKHVALAYDPALGAYGRWTLLVEGEAVGSLDNVWWPGSGFVNCQRFSFGKAVGSYGGLSGFSGVLDQWRVSGRVLTKKELLNVRSGLMLIFR